MSQEIDGSVRRLASARQKIGRARKHYTDAQQVWNEFAANQPSTESLTLHVHPDTGEKRFIVQSPKIPAELALAVGDVVHNLRTALDHITVGTASKAGLVDPNSKRGTRRIRFPTHADRERFLAGFESNIGGPSAPARSLFRMLQPYENGLSHCLWLLSQLDNIDKHRIILFVDPKMSLAVDGVDIPLGHPGVEQAKAYGVAVAPGVSLGEEVQIHVHPAIFEPGIAMGEPLFPTLVQMIEFTERVVGIFARFIWKEATQLTDATPKEQV